MSQALPYRAFARYHRVFNYWGRFVFNLQGKEPVLILILSVVVLASGADLVADLSHGTTKTHILQEAAIVAISVLAIAWMIMGLRRQAREIELLKAELAELSDESMAPKKYILEARKTLSSVISQQFEEWKLTESEADVGRLLLKGLSLKEIAVLRQTLEKTVRQQASSIYRKAGLSGRHSFSAWFIEDIL